jgi:MoxR-like ATPases
MIDTIKAEIQKVIIGQENLVDNLLIGLIAGGHILVESVPGLAKTTAINTLAKALGIDFKRIQFTPDLLPSDLTGSQIYNPKSGEFSIKQGPIFTNLLLADEINRSPAKVQSALLEVMAEKQVTIANESFKIDGPFW